MVPDFSNIGELKSNEEIGYSIEDNESARIWKIYPNEQGVVIVPEFIIENGIKYTVKSINFGKNGKFKENVVAEKLYLPKSVVRFRISNPYIKEFHYFGNLENLTGFSKRCSSLNKVIVHGEVKRIGYGAFKDCANIKEIHIEKGNTPEIYCSAFENCSSLECILVDGKPISLEYKPNTFCLSAFCGCKSYKYFEGKVILQDGLLLSLDRTELYTIVGRPNDDGCYIIPSTVNDMLHDMAYSELRSIDFSKTQLSEIFTDAFSGCITLEEVILPEHGVEIGDRAFSDCQNLKNVSNFDKITKFGIAAFYHTGIKKCILSSGISEIPASVFLGCSSLEEVVIPESVKTITNNVFEGCSKIKSVKISKGFQNSLDVLFKDAKDVVYTFFSKSSNNHYRASGAYTHGELTCPYCGSSNRRTYMDGTAECNNCGGEYRYW